MASSATKMAEELGKTLKEGERLVGPTRRPDGTLRKPIRIRAGYVPQDEVAVYQSRGALLRKGKESQAGPPGYEPETETKPKNKAAKRNERKKEKKQQASLEKSVNLELDIDDSKEAMENAQDVESVASRVRQLALSTSSDIGKSSSNSMEDLSTDNNAGVDIEKKIRALKKKIRLAEGQLQKVTPQDMKPEQLEKVKKLEGWREELKLLEDQHSA
ncbi:partner of Y14 and mago [Silene latifolia]|uniref:partner of Y14 and mago n=1 Tax=Silene latifolia TaxID=37657 RepID=UPI003D76C29C